MTFSILCIAAAIISFLGTVLCGNYLLPLLRRLCIAQPVESDEKRTQETVEPIEPIVTMGGLCFLIPTMLCALIFIACNAFVSKTAGISDVRIWAGILMSVLFAAVGFMDDFFCNAKRNGTGFPLSHRLALQGGIIILYLSAIWIFSDLGTGTTYIPFVGTVELGIWYYVLSLPLILGVVNSVGETDGADGLCSTAAFFSIVCVMMTSGMRLYYDNGVFAAAVAGGCIGFLVFNFPPAKLKIGKTGSWFLAAVLCSLTYGCNIPILLPLYGLVFVVEGAVILLNKAVAYFAPPRRLFKDVPIYRMLQKRGMGDMQLSALYGAVTFVAGILAVTVAAAG